MAKKKDGKSPRAQVALYPQVKAICDEIRQKYPLSYSDIFMALVMKYGRKEYGLESTKEN